jgi:hypothetical protein
MKLIKKELALLLMKFVSILFLCTMFFKGFSLILADDSVVVENSYDCSKYLVFHICAFTLGAFWNVKRLLKLGIL